MSPDRFDIVRRGWKDRQPFQGAATAYIRYVDSEPLPWKNLQRFLWINIFEYYNSRTKLLDLGTGVGKVVDEATCAGLKTENIYANEPNDILREEFEKRHPGIRVYGGTAENLDQTIEAGKIFNLITANMVFNHMPTEVFEKAVLVSKSLLEKKGGTLAYVIPHPEHEAEKFPEKYGVSSENEEYLVEEPAPWGGFTEYYHRSTRLQVEILRKRGFRIGLIEYGYEDTMLDQEIYPHFEWKGRPELIGAKRLMVIARLGKPLPESMLTPWTVNPQNIPWYELNKKYGDPF